MQKKPLNILSFNTPFFPNANHNHRSKKINNKFKKSSTAQYSTKTKEIKSNTNYLPDTPIGINSINNNIYLNLFNKFNNNNNNAFNTSSLKQNMMSPKEIISNRINNNQMNKIRKNLNLHEITSSSSFKNNNNKSTYIQPDFTNSMNVISSNKGHINIRLNLKNQFMNNILNNNNYNVNGTDNNNINYGLDIAEKMKEKDMKIIQLQNDLLKSQEIINSLNNNININNSFKYNKNKSNINNYNINLNKSSREKNFFMLTKSSESVDKILKTTFNEYYLNNKKQSNKIHKNSFLKKSGNDINKKRINNANKKNKNIKSNEPLYTTNNIKTKRQKKFDYLKLFLPISNLLNIKPRFNSYSNERKNTKNKINFNSDNSDKKIKPKIKINNYAINKKKEECIKYNFSDFTKKCENLKQRANQLINNYINLVNSRIESETK